MKHFSEKTGPAFLACAEAALRGDCAFVIRETERSVSLDDTDDGGRSLLHYAVEGGSLPLVKYLVEVCQMDPLWADCQLVTPFDIAGGNIRTCGEKGTGAGCQLVTPFGTAGGHGRTCSGAGADESACSATGAAGHDEAGEEKKSIYEYLKGRTGFGLEGAYRNPVCPSMHPDSSIVRVGRDYYMVNSSFVFFPGLPVSHSRDLVHWEVIGYAFSNPEWAEELLAPLDGGRGFWAPDISFVDGKFVICATLRNNDDMPYPQTQALMTADNPQGPYSKPIIFNQDGIDPSLFADDDGKKYMLVNRGARLIPLSDDLTEMTGDPVMIAYGAAGAIPEGPHLFKKDGFYYLLLAEGGTGKGHRATVLRSRNLYGPYEKSPYNPLVTQPDPAGALQCCGHADIVETDDGRWFIVYLCSRFIDGQWGMLGRETCLDEVAWTADGWPRLKYGPGPSSLAPLPYPESAETGKSNSYGKHFDWFSPRVIDEKYIEIENNVSAFLTGSGRDLTDRNPGSLLLKHQRAFTETDTFAVRAVDAEPGDEAGVTLYYDENSFIKFGLRKSPEGDEFFVSEYSDNRYVREVTSRLLQDRQVNGAACMADAGRHAENTSPGRRKADHAADAGIFSLTVETDGLKRVFIVGGKEICSWDDVTGICSEGLKKGKRFTGSCVGIFVHGRGTYQFTMKPYGWQETEWGVSLKH